MMGIVVYVDEVLIAGKADHVKCFCAKSDSTCGVTSREKGQKVFGNDY